MISVKGTKHGEFFYNIRDVDAEGLITRAFSKLNFDKLKNNPVTRRNWKNGTNTNNRKKDYIGKKGTNTNNQKNVHIGRNNGNYAS